jgi:hypothetical protein
MWIIRISLDCKGDKFSPKKFIKEIEGEFRISTLNEPDDPNERDPDGVYGFGSLFILPPTLYALERLAA